MRTRASRDHARVHSHPDYYVLFRGLARGGAGGLAAGRAADLFASMVDNASAQLRHAGANSANCARVQRWLEHALQNVSAEMFRAAQRGAEPRELASTCTVMLRVGDSLIFASVGPANAFVFRRGAAYRLGPSRAGPPAPSESSHLGGESMPAVHTQTLQIVDGDIFFLCSPGLVPDREAESLLAGALGEASEEAVAAFIVREARRRGETGCASVLTIRTPAARHAFLPFSHGPGQPRQATTLAPQPSVSEPPPRATPPVETTPIARPFDGGAVHSTPPGSTHPDGGASISLDASSSTEPFSSSEAAKLSRLRLFDAFSHGELARLAELLEPRIFHPGATIVREGERSNALFVLTAGTAVVRRGGRSYLRLLAGQPFGEMALLSGRPRVATVEARSLVHAVELSRASYERLAVVEPSLALKLVEKLAQTLCLHLETQLDARLPRGPASAAESSE